MGGTAMAKQSSIAVTVPSVGESVSSGLLTNWLVKEGDQVMEGDTLFELETEKATLDIPAPSSGVIHLESKAGAEVAIGEQIATIVPEAPSNSLPSPTSAAPSPSIPAASPASNAATSPAVRRIAQEHELDTRTIAGSGPDGRITRSDILNAVEQRSHAASTAPTAKPPPRSLKSIGSASSPQPSLSAHNDSDTIQRVPLSNIRKRIAANLVASKQNAAHLTTFNEIDMTEPMALRSQYREQFEEQHGIRLGFMSFFVTAVCQALLKYPEVNAQLEGEEIIYHSNCHIGVALASDKGLIVPVIRNANHKDFARIEQEIKEFARLAQERRLLPDSLIGGTFSISNGGVFGSLLSTPIPNPPQTAILGMHSIQRRPAVVEGQIAIRPLMYVALTYDHRLIDGREGVGFLRTIKEYIEEPARLMLKL